MPTSNEIRKVMFDISELIPGMNPDHRQVFNRAYDILEQCAQAADNEIDTTDAFDGEEVEVIDLCGV